MNNLLDDLEYDTFLVNETDVNQRLDKFLSLQYVNLSRSYIQTLITETYVFVNDKNEKSSYKVELNDKITIFFTVSLLSNQFHHTYPHYQGKILLFLSL